MNPKDGQAGNAVTPAEPEKADDADTADPGKVEEAPTTGGQAKNGSAKSRKAGSPGPQPHKPPAENEESSKKSYIEVELKDEANKPVAGEAYEITLPDGTVAKGTLDGNGFARIDGIDPGTCKVTFPDLDKDAWDAA